MTDRMSNIEIEDVLSSIRKLVSDDLRPGPSPVAPPPATRPAVPRLVLTQALRVHPDRAPVASAPADDGLAGRLAELESLMAGQDHEFEDESPDSLSAAPEPRHPDEAPEAPFVSDAGDEGAALSWTEPTALRAAPDGPDAASPLVDDAMMRALIRDVLREELQGDMGERVTRNLRKLVRAEIARALTARGLA